MLINLDTLKPITFIPHQKEYDTWKKRLTSVEFDAIFEELENKISSGEIHTSSWMPGSDWSGTVYQPIFEKACLRNEESAAQFFGLILWVVMQSHPDPWGFGRYQINEIDIKGLTYFRIHI